ncbi:hypothetical protein VOM14_20570 [Paraburkholderia sp. MPAMCS5]|nr:hypothetical protein [Paraburkholderia sp. MPAMCS5]
MSQSFAMPVNPLGMSGKWQPPVERVGAAIERQFKQTRAQRAT